MRIMNAMAENIMKKLGKHHSPVKKIIEKRNETPIAKNGLCI